MVTSGPVEWMNILYIDIPYIQPTTYPDTCWHPVYSVYADTNRYYPRNRPRVQCPWSRDENEMSDRWERVLWPHHRMDSTCSTPTQRIYACNTRGRDRKGEGVREGGRKERNRINEGHSHKSKSRAVNQVWINSDTLASTHTHTHVLGLRRIRS